MVRSNVPPSDKLLLEAVELRIGGFKWEIVARKLKRAFDTVRKWPMRYPDRWETAILRAEQRLTIDSNAESVVVLRNMLRGDDIKMQWHAAKTLTGLRIDLGKLALRIRAAQTTVAQPADPEQDQDYKMFCFLRQRSDAELDELADLVRSHPAMEAAHGPSGQATEGAGCERRSVCVADHSAHDQHDPNAIAKGA